MCPGGGPDTLALLRCGSPRGRWAEGPLSLSPKAPGQGRGGGGRAPGSAQPEGVGAPQFPAPPTHRDAAAAAAAAAAAGGVGAAKPPPARRLPSAVPLSSAARPRHPVAAGASARVPHGRSGSGSGSRVIPRPFFFNGGHRDGGRGPPAALPLAAAPSRGRAPPWPPAPLGEGGCGGGARPPGESGALWSPRLARWGGAI